MLKWLLVLSSFCVAVRGKPADCVKWGSTFDVPLESKNVRLDCSKTDGRPVCCAALNTSLAVSRGVGWDFSKTLRTSRESRAKCEVVKHYVPSPQETRDLEYARQLDLIADQQQRFDALMKYVVSDEVISNSTKWLNRVSIHMSSENTPPETADDTDFLSYFLVTRTCGQEEHQWKEWIEPITITARHPFGFGRCRPTAEHYKGRPKVGRSNTDYVLLQSGRHIYNSTYSPSGKKIGRKPVTPGGLTRHFLIDAGTSNFDSSLYWFTCGYSQRMVSFDQVYGFEMTILNPLDYWPRVPPLWKPFWHFLNVPISADPSHPDSPVHLLKTLATPSDFVSFKLDVDNSDTEMPIALSLLSDPAFAQLVDEFFFELHFQCEVMTSCGWGKRVPAESNGLKLDRSHVLEFFQNLRHKGIRAHIWP